MSILLERQDAVATVQLGQDNECSIIEYSDAGATCVAYVHWSNAYLFDGQPLFIDRETLKLKFSVYSMHPVRIFRDVRVVHPAIGVMREKAKDMRVAIGPRIIALKVMWEVAVAANAIAVRPDGPALGVVSAENCCVCDHDYIVVGAGDDAERPVRCSLCLVTSHKSCCSRYIVGDRALPADLHERLMPFMALQLPDIFANPAAVCQLCNALLAELSEL